MERYYPDCGIFGMDDQSIFNGMLNNLLNTKNQKDGIGMINPIMDEIDKNIDKIEVTFKMEPLRQGAYGIVATGTYENKPVIVKRRRPFQGKTIDLTSFLIEAIIQGILYKLTEGECPVKVPQLYKFAKCEFPVYETRLGVRTQRFETAYVLVMEEIKGEELSRLRDDPLQKHLVTIMEGLEFLQKEKFVHRDFHSGNIMIRDETPYIIDFGRACVGGITSEGTIQDYKEFYTNCTNKSHDVCCLLLDLAENRHKLHSIAISICDAYKEKVKNSPRPEYDNDSQYNGHHWTDKRFHWHYAAALVDVELEEYVPEKLLNKKLVCRLRF
jgi:predicted Ser/Thr protein kinase